MAEYLLKGGKMLAKTCPKCGSPLFEYKGETFCVVCADQEQTGTKKTGVNSSASGTGKTEAGGGPGPHYRERMEPVSPENEGIEAEIQVTIIHLCGRIRAESDPENCLILMDCVARGIEALKGLGQR
jgi:UPF0148 protein